MTENSGPDKELIRSVWEEARDLVKRLEGTTVQKFKVEAGEYKIEIERGAPAMVAAAPAAPAPAAAPAAPLPFDSELDGAAATSDLGHAILAPLVGTFYRAPQPGAPPFFEEGDSVDEGQTVGIVEAMKLMNEVKADRSGKILQFAATDGDWVEFEQPLVYLEPAGE